MNIYSAAYNFPSDFLWGISTQEDFAAGKGNPSLLYQLKENAVDAVSVYLKWPDYEPLKGNYDEALIDSTRSLFTRIHTQNLEIALILDLGEVPHWQNLEKTQNNDFSDERYHFALHLADALVPYVNYIGLRCSDAALYNPRLLRPELDVHQDIHNYVQTLSEQVMVGTVIPRDTFRKKSSVRNIFRQLQLQLLKSAKMDFLGLSAENASEETIKTVYEKTRIPLLYYTDNLHFSSPESQMEDLIEKIYGMWHFYQKGWPILGYFSETDILTESPAKEVYTNCCRRNSLELSTENPNLPAKWVRFLKD